jgi:hypothetical protein
LSGRLVFRKHHGFDSVEAKEKWSLLPKESKYYWRLRGKGFTDIEIRSI